MAKKGKTMCLNCLLSVVALRNHSNLQYQEADVFIALET